MGEVNTRNMKIEDLKFFLAQIKENLDEDANGNATESLKKSIVYWDEKIKGDYAKKVAELLLEFSEQEPQKLTASEILGERKED